MNKYLKYKNKYLNLKKIYGGYLVDENQKNQVEDILKDIYKDNWMEEVKKNSNDILRRKIIDYIGKNKDEKSEYIPLITTNITERLNNILNQIRELISIF